MMKLQKYEFCFYRVPVPSLHVDVPINFSLLRTSHCTFAFGAMSFPRVIYLNLLLQWTRDGATLCHNPPIPKIHTRGTENRKPSIVRTTLQIIPQYPPDSLTSSFATTALRNRLSKYLRTYNTARLPLHCHDLKRVPRECKYDTALITSHIHGDHS